MGLDALQASLMRILKDEDDVDRYSLLGWQLKRGETIMLADGRVMDNKLLLVEAIRLRADSMQFFALSDLLQRGETVTLADGRTMDRVQLLVESLKMHAFNSFAVFQLGNILPDHEEVTLADGRTMDRKALLVEAAHQIYAKVYAFLSLALLMVEGEIVLLKDGQRMNRFELVVEAYRAHPNAAGIEWLLILMGLLLKPGETVDIARDGSRVGRRQLLLEGLKTNPQTDLGLVALAIDLAPGETVVLPADMRWNPKSDSKWDSRRLLIEAFTRGFNGPQEFMDRLPEVWSAMDYATASDETAAFLHSIRARDLRAFAVCALRRRLAEGETVHLQDGSSVTRARVSSFDVGRLFSKNRSAVCCLHLLPLLLLQVMMSS
eukprot:m.52618 g.52618  ORF g.52618 m.52618 type:complete len:377 (+) comp13090_c0_seq1:153-1283(+)